MTMEEQEITDELTSFLGCGIYRLPESNAVFVDPVRLLNVSYSLYRVSASGYYCRSFDPSARGRRTSIEANDSSGSKKRKKKKKRPLDLNEREMAAEKLHQEVRPFLLKAHEALLGTTELLSFLPSIVKDVESSYSGDGVEQNFVELGSLWQAPFYEISLHAEGNTKTVQDEGCSDQGFSLIVIDPPWENGSAYKKSAYPTLPNRYFLYLPIKQLAHRDGALVVLWMTNRGKLRAFVEKELFPAWEVTDVRTAYWLKIKPDGSLLGELDLFHHRPYEYLLLCNVNKKETEPDFRQTCKSLPNTQIIVSIPGTYSRKPPLGKLLADHVPGPKPSRCLELFARELVAGWTSWGNEPLRFQDSRFFVKREAKNDFT